MNCVGDTYPETESRSILRTITFLCVEGMIVRDASGGGREYLTATLKPKSGLNGPPVRADVASDQLIDRNADQPSQCLWILALFFKNLPESALAVAKM